MGSSEQKARSRRAVRSASARQLATVLCWWIALLLLWILFVDSLEPPEILVGIGATTVAWLAAVAVRRHGGTRFQPRLRWLGLLRSIPWGILRDSALLAAALWRRLARREHAQGAFRLVRFPAGGDDPTAAAWRALAIAGTSLTPNTYVVGIDREAGTALVHQLVPQSARKVRAAVVGAASGEEQRDT